MTLEEFRAQAKWFMNSLEEFLNGYREANPEWTWITFNQIAYCVIECFKALLENPEEKAITWESPFVELRYPVLANWEKVEPIYFTLTQEDFEAQAEKPESDYSRLEEKFTSAFMTVKEVCVFRLITKDILYILDKGKRGFKLPLALDKRLARLSKKERTRRIIKTVEKIMTRLKITLYKTPGAGKGRAMVHLFLSFKPCVLNVDEKQAYYPILVGLEFKGIQPKDIDPETRAEIFKTILDELKRRASEEKLGFMPKPTVKPVSREASLVKVGLHAELQKFGHRPHSKQLGLFDSLLDETKKEITERGIEVIGLDITPAQNQALFAIQKLLTDTNYKGNIPGREEDSRAFHFSGYLPAIEFTPAQYLKAYGLTKHKTARGWEEYSGDGRRVALRALIDLAKKTFLLVYKRKYLIVTDKGKKEERIDRIETIAPLFRIIRGWEALTKYEAETLDQGQSTQATDEKLKAIAIEPAPILIQDIHRYFVLKPANYIQEINLLYPWPDRPSKYTYRLIDWLITQAELKRRHKQPLVIEENLEEIAYHLRMEAYIKTNNFKRIRQIINKSYRVAKELGYLLSYETVQGQTKELERLELNPEKFSRVREIEEELERLEDKKPTH